MTAEAKRQLALELLAETTVFVHFDARRDGVVVPQSLSSTAIATFEVGLNMPVPIRDLTVDDKGISGTLSFNRRPAYCSVPWSAIYALSSYDRRGRFWPDDAPPGVHVNQKRLAAEYEVKQKRAGLRLVK